VFSLITERTLTAESPTYETVLELDRLVRAKTLPAYLNVFIGREDENCTPSVYMRGYARSGFDISSEMTCVLAVYLVNFAPLVSIGVSILPFVDVLSQRCYTSTALSSHKQCLITP
jgi:hypothetical protein